jgi:hypothetical protein
LPSCHCCTFSLSGPARPEPSTASTPQPKLSGLCRYAAGGRSRRRRLASRRAEAVGGTAHPVGRGRQGCGASHRAEAVIDASPDLRRGPAIQSGLTGDRGRRPTPEGVGSPHRPRPMWAPAVHRGGVAGSESRCAALVMLRSAEADPHVTNRALRACRRTGLLRLHQASFRGPKALERYMSKATLQSERGLASRDDRSRTTRPRARTEVGGASGDARCQAPPSAPLRWSS